VLMSLLSLLSTGLHSAERKGNHFSFHPLVEVAVLFFGIFITMIPCLIILQTHAHKMGISSPFQFFWATGVISSFLDNAPTYLTMSAIASGLLGFDANVLLKLASDGTGQSFLSAISCGAVFMGANTYIGNAPNFMVRSIAEERGIRMPSFFGYLAWSVLILVPVFVLFSFVFFH
jgi:Na+/H+ antiporter NhaD/arsenite permease-like protein